MSLYRAILESLYFNLPNNIATTDFVTRTYNRNWYEYVLKNRKHWHPVYVTMIDMDNLKKINDTYGHHVGDKMLIEFANNVLSGIKDSELVHLGGDEFLLITDDNPTDELEGLQFSLSFEKLPIGFSFGVVQKMPADDVDSAKEKADKLMYEQKLQRKAERVD